MSTVRLTTIGPAAGWARLQITRENPPRAKAGICYLHVAMYMYMYVLVEPAQARKRLVKSVERSTHLSRNGLIRWFTSKDASPTLSPVPSPSMDDLPVATADAVSRALELPTIEIRALKTELSRVQGLLDDHIAEEGRMTQR